MAKKRTPYEVLGVDPKADGETVKKAHRKRARETHPDRGGTSEEFREVSTSFAILSDPVSRKRYEETGDESERIPDQWQKTLAQEFVGALQEIVSFDKVESIDLVEMVKRRLRTKLQECGYRFVKFKKAESGLKKVLSRLKDPKGFLVPILNNQLAELTEDLRKVGEITENLNASLKYVEDCRYVYEQRRDDLRDSWIQMGVATFRMD